MQVRRDLAEGGPREQQRELSALMARHFEEAGFQPERLSRRAEVAEFLFGRGQDEAWLVATSGYLGSELIRAIHEYNNVFSIVVLCSAEEEAAYQDALLPLSAKVKEVFGLSSDVSGRQAAIAHLQRQLEGFWWDQPLNPSRVSSTSEVRAKCATLPKRTVSTTRKLLCLFNPFLLGLVNVAFITYNLLAQFGLFGLGTSALSDAHVPEPHGLGALCRVAAIIECSIIGLLVVCAIINGLIFAAAIRRLCDKEVTFEAHGLPDYVRWSPHFFMWSATSLSRFSLFRVLPLCNVPTVVRLYRSEVRSRLELCFQRSRTTRLVVGVLACVALVTVAFVTASVSVATKLAQMVFIYNDWNATWSLTKWARVLLLWIGLMNQLAGLVMAQLERARPATATCRS